MSIDLILFLTMLVVTTFSAVVLSVCIDVVGCLWTISSRVCHSGMDFCQLMKRAPGLASVADDMTALINLEMVSTVQFFGGVAVLLGKKK